MVKSVIRIPKFFLVIGIFIVAINTATSLHALEVPKPRGFVNDFANVIRPEEAQKLEYILTSLEQKTGIEFAVMTLISLEGEPLKDFSTRIFQEWGIGKRKQAKGLLILAAIQERQARIEVGKGLEAIIPDSVTGPVLRDVILPEFKKEAYGKGLLQGAMAIVSMLEDAKGINLPGKAKAQLQGQGQRKSAGPLPWIFRILILVGAVMLLIKYPFSLFFGDPESGSAFQGGGFGRGKSFGGFGGGLSGSGGAKGNW